MLDEFSDAAGEAEFGGFFVAFVGESDLQALVEKGEFAKALGQGVEAVDGFVEDGGVRMKSDFGAGFAGLAGLLELGGGLAFFVGLLPYGSIARNFQLEPVGESVDHGNADTVEAAGNFVGVAVEFSAGVEDGENDFGGGTLFGGVHVDGNAAAIVDDRDGIVGVHGDVDFIGKTGHGFVDGIVDNFPDQVMQTHLAGGTDVHGGAQTNGFESAKDLDGFCVVLVARSCAGDFFIAHEDSTLISLRTDVEERMRAPR